MCCYSAVLGVINQKIKTKSETISIGVVNVKWNHWKHCVKLNVKENYL